MTVALFAPTTETDWAFYKYTKMNEKEDEELQGEDKRDAPEKESCLISIYIQKYLVVVSTSAF